MRGLYEILLLAAANLEIAAAFSSKRVFSARCNSKEPKTAIPSAGTVIRRTSTNNRDLKVQIDRGLGTGRPAETGSSGSPTDLGNSGVT